MGVPGTASKAVIAKGPKAGAFIAAVAQAQLRQQLGAALG
jgi:hypothetical protein